MVTIPGRKPPFFNDLFTIPQWGPGVKAVWSRNLLYFRYTMLVSFFWMILEPLFYLLAIGFCLGTFIPTIDGVSYLEFFFPALLCSTAMVLAFFDATYGNFTKLAHQKTYQTIMLTRVSPSEIVLGELLWAFTRGFMGVVGLVLVSFFLGLIRDWHIFPALAVVALVSWAFSCFGMWVTSVAKNYDSFTFASSGIIIPMSLFSGTYFPVDHIPIFFKVIAYCLPLTHGVAAVRQILVYGYSNTLWMHVAYLFLFGFFMMNLAFSRIRRRLIS